ncbi:MAG: ABC transporter permease [Candidatus Limivicinus sp.]|nr:ABC transporter permease [Candidatus Limivicinus sp.]
MAASYNLNEVLKAKEAAEQNNTPIENEEIHLDDVSRVKVLSPGRQVFKRFIRNRLAVFGSAVLIFMFVFSFLGPLFYAHGQTEIFYKYNNQNVNYALAKENSAYNGYVVNDSVELDSKVVTAMNSNIKSMIEEGKDYLLVEGETGNFEINRLGDEIYTLSGREMDEICAVGTSTVTIGTYDSVGKKLKFSGEEIEGLEDAAKACKGKSGEFKFGGETYSYKKGSGKSYTITKTSDGINYAEGSLGEEFEAAMLAAIESEAKAFSFEGVNYTILNKDETHHVYTSGEPSMAMVYTRFTLDTYETGLKVSDEFRVNALLAAYDSGKFSYEGQKYTIKSNDDVLEIFDAQGNEFAEFSTISIRRYSGEDSMDYDLKKTLNTVIEEMQEKDLKTAELTYRLPMQDENGVYTYDEQGNLQYEDGDLTISQRDTGSYVINCQQTIYVIDKFAAPSGTHVLGTDGDGFDVLARIMYGGRISLMVGFVVVFLEILLGVIMGGLAGYYGGWVDNLIMRLVDIFYCLPSMPIMIILGAMMDALRMNTYVRLMIMMAALGIMGWAGVARMVRGQILSLREQEFMVATEATGIRVKDRIFRHLVPNVMPQLIVIASLGIGGTIITESTLSFLGLGVKHPLATWGTIINSVSSASAMAHYPFIWIPVGLLICMTVIAFNFVGDGLRDAYDPKAKR